MMRYRTAIMFLILSLASLSHGCSSSGEKTVAVRGTLLKGGVAYDPTSDIKGDIPPEDPGVRVIFTRLGEDKAGQEYHAVIDKAAGTFEVPGNAGKGIPPARYQVKVYVGAFGGAPPAPRGRSNENIPPEYQTEAQKNQPAFSYGKEIASQEVDVTDGGANEIAIEVKKQH